MYRGTMPRDGVFKEPQGFGLGRRGANTAGKGNMLFPIVGKMGGLKPKPESLTKEKPEWSMCKICDVSFLSEQAYKIHCTGMLHIKNETLHKRRNSLLTSTKKPTQSDSREQWVGSSIQETLDMVRADEIKRDIERAQRLASRDTVHDRDRNRGLGSRDCNDRGRSDTKSTRDAEADTLFCKLCNFTAMNRREMDNHKETQLHIAITKTMSFINAKTQADMPMDISGAELPETLRDSFRVLCRRMAHRVEFKCDVCMMACQASYEPEKRMAIWLRHMEGKRHAVECRRQLEQNGESHFRLKFPDLPVAYLYANQGKINFSKERQSPVRTSSKKDESSSKRSSSRDSRDDRDRRDRRDDRDRRGARSRWGDRDESNRSSSDKRKSDSSRSSSRKTDEPQEKKSEGSNDEVLAQLQTLLKSNLLGQQASEQQPAASALATMLGSALPGANVLQLLGLGKATQVNPLASLGALQGLAPILGALSPVNNLGAGGQGADLITLLQGLNQVQNLTQATGGTMPAERSDAGHNMPAAAIAPISSKITEAHNAPHMQPAVHQSPSLKETINPNISQQAGYSNMSNHKPSAVQTEYSDLQSNQYPRQPVNKRQHPGMPSRGIGAYKEYDDGNYPEQVGGGLQTYKPQQYENIANASKTLGPDRKQFARDVNSGNQIFNYEHKSELTPQTERKTGYDEYRGDDPNRQNVPNRKYSGGAPNTYGTATNTDKPYTPYSSDKFEQHRPADAGPVDSFHPHQGQNAAFQESQRSNDTYKQNWGMGDEYKDNQGKVKDYGHQREPQERYGTAQDSYTDYRRDTKPAQQEETSTRYVEDNQHALALTEKAHQMHFPQERSPRQPGTMAPRYQDSAEPSKQSQFNRENPQQAAISKLHDSGRGERRDITGTQFDNSISHGPMQGPPAGQKRRAEESNEASYGKRQARTDIQSLVRPDNRPPQTSPLSPQDRLAVKTAIDSQKETISLLANLSVEDRQIVALLAKVCDGTEEHLLVRAVTDMRQRTPDLLRMFGTLLGLTVGASVGVQEKMLVTQVVRQVFELMTKRDASVLQQQMSAVTSHIEQVVEGVKKSIAEKQAAEHTAVAVAQRITAEGPLQHRGAPGSRQPPPRRMPEDGSDRYRGGPPHGNDAGRDASRGPRRISDDHSGQGGPPRARPGIGYDRNDRRY